jgi:hypothetical protein
VNFHGARVMLMPVIAAGLIWIAITASPASAQPPDTTPHAPFSERWQVEPAAPVRAAQKPPAPAVRLDQALYLIRSTLLTLNDANRSGNYTVLRDLASPDFQARNSAADLAHIFADLRQRKFDLFGVALLAPQLSAPPQRDANNMLRLTGVFQTRPLMIQFDLLFQDVGGQWRLYGISVATPPAPAAAAPPAPTAKAAPLPRPAPASR